MDSLSLKSPKILHGFAISMLTSAFFSVIPIFTLRTTGLRNKGPYVGKSQKLWKPTPLFTYVDLVQVCRIKLQVALKLENNLRF